MRPRHHLISAKLALLLIFGIAGGVFLAFDGLNSEATTIPSPTPSMHVDIGSSFIPSSTGNTYDEDPTSHGDGSDQLMSVPPITSCVRRDIDNFAIVQQKRIITDIIIKNADELTGAGVRINFDPSKINFVLAFETPLTSIPAGFTGQPVSLLNLPIEPAAILVHRTVTPGFQDNNTEGAIFLGASYLMGREFDVSSESGPVVDGAVNSLPNRNAGQAPNGGVFVRILWDLQDQAPFQTFPTLPGPEDLYDVRIDLTVSGPMFTGGTSAPVITAGSDFGHLTSEDPLGTALNIKLSSAELFDGIVSVNQDIPSPCPPPEPLHDVEAKHIGGAGGSAAKLFQGCNSDPCTLTQVHRLVVANNSDHIEDIRVKYQVFWPQDLIDAACSVNTISSSPVILNNSIETGVSVNATRNVKVTVTYSCPAAAESADGVIGAPISFLMEAVHRRAGGDSQPDDDAINDFDNTGKLLE